MGKKDRRRRRRYSPSESDPSASNSVSRTPTKDRKKSKYKSSKGRKSRKYDRDRKKKVRRRSRDERKKSSKKEKRRSLSSLSSYSQSSEDSLEKKRRKKRRRDNIRQRMYRKSKSPDDDPLAKYRRKYASNTNEFGNPVIWDGFQWVEKGGQTVTTTMDSTQLAHTKKMRKVQITNLPVYMGLREKDIKSVVSDFLLANYLTDEGNKEPILECELDEQNKTAVVECSSVEEATRFAKVNYMNILGVKCKVTRVGESMYGATTNLATILNDADTEAKATAYAHKALDKLKEDGMLNMTGDMSGFSLDSPLSSIVKIYNLVDPEQALMLTTREYREILSDIKAQASEFAEIDNCFIIRSHNSTIGAEPGCVFMRMKDKEGSKDLIEGMKIKNYNGRLLRAVCIPEQTYNTFFLRLDI